MTTSSAINIHHFGNTRLTKARRGEYHHKTILVDKQVIEAKRLHIDGKTIPEIANKLNVSYKTIYSIVRGLTWRHLILPS